MRGLLIMGITLLTTTLCIAQPLQITIKDTKKAPLTGATVQLTQLPDSTRLFSVTDEAGVAQFEKVPAGLYGVSISYIGFQALEKAITVKVGGNNRFEFTLREDALTLGEVTVTARRPLIRQEDDKMIIDPEPLASISTSTLEVLEKTPGLFVDQEGGIYLNSSTPAQILINGREQRMSTQDIATILQSLPPGNVQRIEVLRTPSTKYDAASSGGIVNVILKKGVKIGRTGSISLGMNQGVYGNHFAGINLNDSGDKATYYFNINYNYRNQLDDLSATRILALDSTLEQVSRTVSPSDQGYAGFGASYDATEKLTFSYDGRINGSLRRSEGRNTNLITTTEDLIVSENDNTIDNDTRFFSLQQDLGAVYKIDTIGSEWDTKFGYSFNDNNNAQDYSSVFLRPFNVNIIGEGDNLQNRHFFLVQSDLTYHFPYKIKLETGVKSTWQRHESHADYYFRVNGMLVNDDLRTNAFNYRENINAAYLQASKPLPGEFLLKAGVRIEHTNMQGTQTVPGDTSFVINRADWFPYVYLSRSLFTIASYQMRAYAIYRRTINRPDYQSLNPYIKYIDQYLYEVGNPALQPQFTDNYEVNISFDDMPIFAIGRNYTTNIFSAVVYQDPDFESVAVRTFDNVGKNRETYFRIVGALPPGGKYFFVAGAQYNLNDYEGLYEGEPLTLSRGSWRFFTFHSLSLTKTTKLTMNGFMMLKGQQNFYELETFGQLNFGLTQTFMERKLSITLNANDVLRTMDTRFSLNQGSISTEGSRYGDNQRFGVNVRYNFGIKKKEEQRGGMKLDTGEEN
ncbi:MAG: TonB-dependent receptor [Saprospiraceae bacterium]|nr:TonB-dependent receptor [Saprospiraceae bacterium]